MPDLDRTYRIGEVARRTGLSVDALRYYERLGLLPHPPRTEGGVRRYGAGVVDRVRCVKQAQTLGLTLREIRDLLGDASPRSRAGCRRVHNLLTQHIDEIDRRMRDLRALRKTLGNYRVGCERALGVESEPACPTLDALEKPTA